jgi:hypothetical protein
MWCFFESRGRQSFIGTFHNGGSRAKERNTQTQRDTLRYTFAHHIHHHHAHIDGGEGQEKEEELSVGGGRRNVEHLTSCSSACGISKLC